MNEVKICIIIEVWKNFSLTHTDDKLLILTNSFESMMNYVSKKNMNIINMEKKLKDDNVDNGDTFGLSSVKSSLSIRGKCPSDGSCPKI